MNELEERVRKLEQNWELTKKQMQILQYQINNLVPDNQKLPPDWLEQLELIRDIVNPPQPSETQTQTEKMNHEHKNP